MNTVADRDRLEMDLLAAHDALHQLRAALSKIEVILNAHQIAMPGGSNDWTASRYDVWDLLSFLVMGFILAIRLYG